MPALNLPIDTAVILGAIIPGALHVHPTSYVHPSAQLLGEVTIGRYCQIGPGTIIAGRDIVIGDHTCLFCNITIRGGGIRIGSYVNIFDHANIESGRGRDRDPAVIGDGCWINHGCVMHGSRVGTGAVIGMNAALNYHCTIGDGAIVMEGTACPVGFVLPDRAVAQGVPATIVRRDITDTDREALVGLVPADFLHRHAAGMQETARALGLTEPEDSR